MAKTSVNVDTLIKLLKPQTKIVIKLSKYDGITIICSTDQKVSADKGILEIESLCKQNKLQPISIEKDAERPNVFALQFPELVPAYSEQDIEKMYMSQFKWLLDGTIANDKENKVTKELIYKYKDVFVKDAILTYYRSNVNRYKEHDDDYINNSEYRFKIDKLFFKFLDDYNIRG